MLCPIDGTELLVTHRDGIEIDICPQCKGVWLDRGELDKVIEKAQEAAMAYRASLPEEPDDRDKANRQFMQEELKRKRGIAPKSAKRSTTEMARSFLDNLLGS